MQRTNISSILNALVKEGCIEKLSGRPVLYRIKQNLEKSAGEQSCFKGLIGCEGSLKSAVQLAKAAILYPKQSLHSLILGPSGSGKSYFANLMYCFAKENKIIKEDSPFIRFNCLNYSHSPEEMFKDLFGIEEDSALTKAKNGILFIDNMELLSASARNSLVQILENNYLEINNQRQQLKAIIICAMNEKVNSNLIDSYSKYFSINIHLTALNERTLNERFELIQHFFTVEAERSNKRININPELLISLLLYHCEENVKQLKRDIQLGYANAYVREFNTGKDDIWVLMSDFPYHVRTGFLNFKNHRNKIKEIISENCNYTFSKEKTTISTINQDSTDKKGTIYEWIDGKVSELSKRGIEDRDISEILSINIDNEFKQYQRRLSERIIDKEQLLQIVDERIIELVNDFLEGATTKFNKVYPVSIFYGLCLHINSTIGIKSKKQRLSNDQIMEIIKHNEDEYAYSVKFVGLLEKEFNVKLSIDEVVFITMFITKDSLSADESLQPVVLLALHGSSAASSIIDVVNFMSGYQAYSYDMPLSKSTSIAYEELKMLITKIHRGKGVFVLYDMGSFKTMCNMISSETGIEIKTLQIPITLMALEGSRQAMMDISLEDIHDNMLNSFERIIHIEKDSYYRIKSNDVILTLCMTGEGSAVQTKRYIEKYVNLKDTGVIPLAMSNKDYLLEEVNKIKEKHNIVCVVGSYDPELIGVKYISMADIFQNNAKELKGILELKNTFIDSSSEDFEIIFDHLSEELKMIDVSRLRRLLPEVIEAVEVDTQLDLKKDQKLALMIHIACCMEHMLDGSKMQSNIYKDEIVNKNKQLYHSLKESFELLEKEFKLVFDDNEIANVISIIKKSKRG